MKYFNVDTTTKNDRLLLIDGTNTFIRAIARVDDINEFGMPIGGFQGFLLSIGAAIKRFQITECIVTFDNKHSSDYRKKIFPEYKGNRNRTKPMNYRLYESVEAEEKSKTVQLTRLKEYLDCLPVRVISLDYFEADDVIAYVAKHGKYKDHKKYIMSTDKDYFQLINDNTVVFNPITKVVIDKHTLLNEFKLIPDNYILYKIMIKDASDNVNGIKGAGLKTLQKYLPILFENTEKIDINGLYDFLENDERKAAILKKIYDGRDILELNYKIMNLIETILDESAITYVDNKLNEPITQHGFNFYRMINVDGINRFNPRKWHMEVFSTIKS